MDPYVQRTQEWINLTYEANPNTPDIGPVTEDGYTGWQTVTALLRALQYELGISNRSDTFGPTTLAALAAVSPVNNATTNKNIVSIAQGAMYCKGYPGGDGYVTGVWNAAAIAGMKTFRGDIGLSAGNGDIEPKVFKALLNMDAFKLVSGGTSTVRTIQQALNGRYLSRRDFYAVPTDGRYTGDVQTALMYAIQYELGLADGVANGSFGPTTKAQLAAQAVLAQGSTDSSKYFVHLFQAALIFNGRNVAFDGAFGAGTKSQTQAFQQFVGLSQTGTATMPTWGSLMVSTGDADRPGTGADCVSTLTAPRLSGLRSAGYTHFGRYLTNTPDNQLDKCIQSGELARVFAAGGRVFPLFQTGGGQLAHFTYDRGAEVGEEAGSAAWAYRIPANTIIYFSVDFDASESEVQNQVIPYFQALPERLGRMGRSYRIGVYAPRRVCHQLNAAGVVVSSFVSDMSIGYGSNKAQVLPNNWAFDQIQTRWEGSGTSSIEIDKNIVSGRDNGFNTLAPAWGSGNDPEIDWRNQPGKWDDMYEEMFRDTYEHENAVQQAYNLNNKANVKGNILALDPHITQLAASFNCRKALILTPLVHESLCFNDVDLGKDAAVRAYYDLVRAPLRPQRRDR
jgi:peptidoglycan hydrolase-like protein with peptidoglycan-binding domain